MKKNKNKNTLKANWTRTLEPEPVEIKVNPFILLEQAITFSTTSFLKRIADQEFSLEGTKTSIGEPWAVYMVKKTINSPEDMKVFLEFMLNRGMDINEKTRTSELTALMVSLLDINRRDIAKILLKAGADPNISDSDGWTPLMRLFSLTHSYKRSDPTLSGSWYEFSHEKIGFLGQLLIEYGADPNLGKSVGNSTALHLAATKGILPLCEVLIKHGARVDVRDASKNRPSDLARKGNHQECLEFLLKHENIVDCETDLEVMTANIAVTTKKKGLRL